MLLEESGEITPERMKRWSQSEDDSQLWDVIGDGSKVRCFKEQYCIGTWNVRSMNQGKLEVVKQEMARVNIYILGELKWTGMGKFNSDDHYIYYCGQESLRRNGVALIVNKRVRNAVQLGSIQLLSRVLLFATPWIAACQASLSITSSRSSTQTHVHQVSDAIQPSHPRLSLFLLPPIPPSIRVFSNESTFRMRWPKYWSFSFSIIPSKEHPGLMSFRMDWLDLLAIHNGSSLVMFLA